MIIRNFIDWLKQKIPAVSITVDIEGAYKQYKEEHKPKRLDWTLPSATLNYYQQQAMLTNNPQEDTDQMLINAALGLSGEAGEVADLVKKWQFQGHEIDREHVAKEIGDVLWYCALGATAINMSLGEVGQMNLDKLEARYKDRKFTAEQSNHRKEGDI